jgi:hypothetical protein
VRPWVRSPEWSQKKKKKFSKEIFWKEGRKERPENTTEFLK